MKTIPDKNFNSDFKPPDSCISSSTIESIINAWQETGIDLPLIRPDIPTEDKELLLFYIVDCIREKGGEISKRAKVIHLAMIYIHLTRNGKERFLKILARHFDVNIDGLEQKVQQLKKAKNDKESIQAELLLRDALVPPRVKLLKQLITIPNGFIFLKDMRCDLLPLVKTDPRLKKLSDEIRSLLETYFEINLLDLKEITWDSPAALLERLFEYEAVHAIPSWKALKHRLQTDHRVFAFFHYRMPDEPLIFVEVALVKGMSDNIDQLINYKVKPGDPAKADTAIFYSISNTQKGLEGISFGNFLIKRVVKELSRDYPNLKEFATLSPMPMFRSWLEPYLINGGNNFFTTDEKKQICKLSEHSNASEGLLKILNIRNWFKNNEITEIVKKPLMRFAAHYVFNVKKPNSIKAHGPVANFHLTNGAKIEHIRWLADVSKRGIAQSAGIMLNYHYRLDKININHEAYMATGKIHASSDARSWLG